MQRCHLTAYLSLVFGFLFLPYTLCSQVSRQPPAKFFEPNSFHQVYEKDRNRLLEIDSTSKAVDANADLLVYFRPPLDTNNSSPGLDWEQASAALRFVQKNQSERMQLVAELRRVSQLDLKASKEFSDKLHKFNSETIKQLKTVKFAARLSDDEWLSILSGEFDGRPSNQPYTNFGRWLRSRLDTLNKQLKSFADERTVQVTVQAFHLPRSGSERPLHVENYDRIPAGEYRPIDRLGLHMNEAEQKEFGAKLKAAEAAAAATREIMTNSSQLKQFFQDKLNHIRKELEKMELLLENDAANSDLNFDNTPIAQELRRLADAPNGVPETRAAATALHKDLGDFNGDFRMANTLYRDINKLIAQIRRGNDGSLSEVVAGLGQIENNLRRVDAAAQGLIARVNLWPVRLQRCIDNARKVADSLNEQIRNELIPDTFTTFIAEFKDKFPAMAEVLKVASGILAEAKGDNGSAAAEEAVGSVSNDQQWFGFINALPGTVELSRTGLAPGDAIRLRVSYRKPAADGSGRLISTDDYKVETALMGLHRVFDAGLIFARGLKGGAAERQWKPNVAASVTWHYRNRLEDTNWQRSWNWLDPGFGLHLASLDQGADSVELGIGPSVSFWNGLVQVGAGFNINNREHPYVFFGIGLLEALEKAKKLRQ